MKQKITQIAVNKPFKDVMILLQQKIFNRLESIFVTVQQLLLSLYADNFMQQSRFSYEQRINNLLFKIQGLMVTLSVN